jgi:hypothetical protein
MKMRIKEDVSKELQILWEMRDRAKDDDARKVAQAKIDEYFLGNPKKDKKKKRKQKKKKMRMPVDEWAY